MPTNKVKTIYKVLALLNALAIPITLYLTYLHFEPNASDICVLSEKWNCDIVNKSIYSSIFGIPVSVMGFFAYLSFLVFSIRGLKVDQSKWAGWFLFVVTGGTAFALYLTGIETFVLKTYCLFCVAQQIIILIEWVYAYQLYKLSKAHA